MTTSDPLNPGKRSFRSLLFNRSTILSFVAGAAVAVAVGVSAQVTAMSGWHHGSMMDGTHSAAEVSAHIDHMLKHFYVEIDATDAQKAQIGPLVKQAVNDLLPLHSQAQTAHQHAMDALSSSHRRPRRTRGRARGTSAVGRPSLEAPGSADG